MAQTAAPDRPSRLAPAILALGMGLAPGFATAPAAASQGDIYRMVDENGVVHFSDDPRDPRFTLFMRAPRPAGEPATTARDTADASIVRPGAARPFHERIVRAAATCNLDPALVHAVVTVESGYNPQAVSPKGAIGLMQLMPGTAERYGVANARDPDANLRGGVRYLCDLLKMFDNDLSLALAGYNAGENAVIRYNRRIPPFAETRAYVPKVLANYRRMRPTPDAAVGYRAPERATVASAAGI